MEILSKWHEQWYKFILDNPDKRWDYGHLSGNPNITWEIIQANPDIDWDYEKY